MGLDVILFTSVQEHPGNEVHAGASYARKQMKVWMDNNCEL
jgi:hypothetical protein